jgi:hypothetical protein
MRHQVVSPSREEAETLNLAIRHARLCGLVLPAGVVEIYWLAPDEPLTAQGYPCGAVTYHLETPIRVYIKRGRGDGLFRLCLHELAHCWDAWHLRNDSLSVLESEQRAEAFVAFALAPLEALSRGERPTFPLPHWGHP